MCWCAVKKLLTHSLTHSHSRQWNKHNDNKIWTNCFNVRGHTLKIYIIHNNKFTYRNGYTHPNNFSSTRFCSKHAQNSRATADIKYNFVFKQMSVVVHWVTIRQGSNFVFQHFLPRQKHKIQSLFTLFRYSVTWYDAAIQQHLGYPSHNSNISS